MKKQIVITSNTGKGENIWHAWNSEQSFFVFTQRGYAGSKLAQMLLNKEFGKIYLSVTHSAHKNSIIHYFA